MFCSSALTIVKEEEERSSKVWNLHPVEEAERENCLLQTVAIVY